MFLKKTFVFISSILFASTVYPVDEQNVCVWPSFDEIIADYQNKMTDDPLILHHMCSAGNLAEAKLLIQLGADVSTKDALGYTPLHWACHSGRLPVIKYLLKRNPNLISTTDKDEETPLFKSFGNIKVLKQLLRSNADLEHKNSDGNTPLNKLMTVAQNSKKNHRHYYKFAEFLLTKHADVNTVNNKNISPLHKAISNNWTCLVKLFCKYNADPNIQTSKGDTPLHYALLMNNKQMLRTLLFKGADVEIKNKKHKSPLQLAKDRISFDLSTQELSNILLLCLFSNELDFVKFASAQQLNLSFKVIDCLANDERKNFLRLIEDKPGYNIACRLQNREIQGNRYRAYSDSFSRG